MSNTIQNLAYVANLQLTFYFVDLDTKGGMELSNFVGSSSNYSPQLLYSNAEGRTIGNSRKQTIRIGVLSEWIEDILSQKLQKRRVGVFQCVMRNIQDNLTTSN